MIDDFLMMDLTSLVGVRNRAHAIEAREPTKKPVLLQRHKNAFPCNRTEGNVTLKSKNDFQPLETQKDEIPNSSLFPCLPLQWNLRAPIVYGGFQSTPWWAV